ncbi:site-specific integrase, partial [Brachybacterium paraconglomeratum]|uniref:site-specific integrase n=1 Tax=Brachybacterium paraconglomeratum TaxID=173362 RepID=UPI00223BE862
MSSGEAPRPTGEEDPLRPGDRRILEQYLGHLRIERGLSENTLAAYRRDLRRYLVDLARPRGAPPPGGPP